MTIEFGLFDLLSELGLDDKADFGRKSGLDIAKDFIRSLAAKAKEAERLKAELGEWWRAAGALNDADDDEAECAALAWLDSLRTGSAWANIPESVAELMAVENARLAAEVARLVAHSKRFYRADGSYEELDSEQAVIERRIEAAKEIERLKAELAEWYRR